VIQVTDKDLFEKIGRLQVEVEALRLLVPQDPPSPPKETSE